MQSAKAEGEEGEDAEGEEKEEEQEQVEIPVTPEPKEWVSQQSDVEIKEAVVENSRPLVCNIPVHMMNSTDIFNSLAQIYCHKETSVIWCSI